MTASGEDVRSEAAPGRVGDAADEPAAMEEAAVAVREWLGRKPPRLAVVLGSGLGGLEEGLEERRDLPYDRIPGWPASGVAGHAGRLVSGRAGDVPLLALSGRSHLYEGQEAGSVARPVRVLRRLGIRFLLLSNAAGAVHRRFRPGQLMLVADHLNLMGRNPLVGPVGEGESRWPDLLDAYDPELRRLAREAARELGIPLQEGVYAGLLGPSYETPAEIEMLRRWGADAVGMSTVPEVIAARAYGLRCAAISCLTNYAAGISEGPLSHEEVIETSGRVAEEFRRLVVRLVEKVGALTPAGAPGPGPSD